MQQRLGLARVLIHDPQLLLLDEPASGLDPRARIEMMAILQELQRLGKTIIISSHILSELQTLCNRVAIIEKGKPSWCSATAWNSSPPPVPPARRASRTDCAWWRRAAARCRCCPTTGPWHRWRPRWRRWSGRSNGSTG